MSTPSKRANKKSNNKKSEQLGVSHGTACNRLRKNILFDLLRKQVENVCFQCGLPIDIVDELSVEHKIPWLDSEDPIGLFFDLDNIAFSHLTCNYGARRCRTEGKTTAEHGTTTMYSRGCRCANCRNARHEYYEKNK